LVVQYLEFDEEGSPCARTGTTQPCRPFEVSSKRRKSFPSETRVKRGVRIVHGDVELEEKLGRNDLCVCGSGQRFQEVLHAQGTSRRLEPDDYF
jgi:hypothetical protein